VAQQAPHHQQQQRFVDAAASPDHPDTFPLSGSQGQSLHSEDRSEDRSEDEDEEMDEEDRNFLADDEELPNDYQDSQGEQQELRDLLAGRFRPQRRLEKLLNSQDDKEAAGGEQQQQQEGGWLDGEPQQRKKPRRKQQLRSKLGAQGGLAAAAAAAAGAGARGDDGDDAVGAGGMRVGGSSSFRLPPLEPSSVDNAAAAGETRWPPRWQQIIDMARLGELEQQDTDVVLHPLESAALDTNLPRRLQLRQPAAAGLFDESGDDTEGGEEGEEEEEEEYEEQQQLLDAAFVADDAADPRQGTLAAVAATQRRRLQQQRKRSGSAGRERAAVPLELQTYEHYDE
jgi:hypothetical protein